MSTASTESSRKAREAVVREHIDAENRHDPDAVVASFSPTRAAYDIPAMGKAGQPSTAEGVGDMWRAFLYAFPDVHVEAGPLLHGDDHVFVEIRMSGTQTAQFAGIPSARRPFDTRVACLFEFQADELVRERVYMDLGEMTRQLFLPHRLILALERLLVRLVHAYGAWSRRRTRRTDQ
jgi:steroid delta-isomerase-like uncharacterized protein